jgi:hypothetical protein
VNQDAITQLRDGILNNVYDDSAWNEAKKQAKQFLAEREEQKKQAPEQARLAKIEADRPRNAFPKLYRHRHVQENFNDLLSYLKTYDLASLQEYANELSQGLHKHAFRGEDSFEALAFLRQQLSRREQTADNQLLTTMKEAHATLKATSSDLKAINEKLNPDVSEKTKSYTT